MGADGYPDDARLVLLAKNGNLDAFNSLVDRYQGAVHTLCYRLLSSREAAEDATQEAFIAAWRALGQFHGGSFRSWLLRIAANQSRDELRRRKRRETGISLDSPYDDPDAAPLDPPDRSESQAARIERLEFSREIETLLERLPFDQRQAVILVDVYDFTYEEVAGLSNANLGTVKSRVHRGRERLRSLLSAQPELFGAIARHHG